MCAQYNASMIFRLLIYIRQRFPLHMAWLLSGLYTIHLFTLSKRSHPHVVIEDVLIIMTLFTLFLLRVRFVDEIKDYDHDARHYPHRPVIQGLLTKKELVFLAVCVLFLELSIMYSYGESTYFFALIVLLYSGAMTLEFGIRSYLKKHFTTHFILHEVVFLWYTMYFLRVLGLLPQYSYLYIITLTSCVCIPVLAEIVRKLLPRKNIEGISVCDTYSTVWGEYTAVSIISVLELILSLSTGHLIGSSLIYLLGSLTLATNALMLRSLWHIRINTICFLILHVFISILS
jgi:4-hydroxybenzoate polyprenyltransferase